MSLPAQCEIITHERFRGDLLPKTMKKLRAGEPLRIVVHGDSTHTGADASSWYKREPFMPGYPELVKRGLHKVYGSDITLINNAVGGLMGDDLALRGIICVGNLKYPAIKDFPFAVQRVSDAGAFGVFIKAGRLGLIGLCVGAGQLFRLKKADARAFGAQQRRVVFSSQHQSRPSS